MYKTVIILLCYPLIAQDVIWYHFSPEDQYSQIPEIYIEINDYEFDFIPTNSIYLRLHENFNNHQVITWNKAELEKHKYKKKTKIFLTKSNYFEEKRKIYQEFGGSASQKISGEINIINPVIIEIPIIESMNEKDVLRIMDLPISISSGLLSKINMDIFCGPSWNFNRIEMEIGKKYNNWKEINTNLVISKPSINLVNPIKYNLPKTSFPISFYFTDFKPMTLTSGREFVFLLDNNAQWTDRFDLINISNEFEKNLDNQIYEIQINKKNTNELKLFLNKEITFDTLYINNIYIDYFDTIDTDISIKLLPTYISKEIHLTKISWFEKIINKLLKKNRKDNYFLMPIQTSTSFNKIEVSNIEFNFIRAIGEDFSINYFDSTNFLLPDILIKQKEKQVLNAGTKFQLIIPDSINLDWLEKNQYSDLYKLEYSTKELSITMVSTLSSFEILKISNLEFNSVKNNITPFNLEFNFPILNNNKIILPENISVGHPDFGIYKNEFLFTLQEDTKLSSAFIVNNGYVIPLDTIVFDFSSSSELQFINEIKPFDNELDYFEYIYSDNVLKIIVKNELPLNKQIMLSELFVFKKLNKPEKDIIPELLFIPGTYKQFRKPFRILEDNRINIIDLEFDLSTSIEFIKLPDKETNQYQLPNLKIKNNSNSETPYLSNLTISIPNIEYAFNIDSLIILNSLQDTTKISCKVQKDRLVINLNRVLKPYQNIELLNCFISFPNKQGYFENRKLTMQVNRENEKTVFSKKVLGYGNCRIQSSKNNQVFFENTNNQLLYEMEIDLSKLPQTKRNLQNININLPGTLAIEWEKQQKITLYSDKRSEMYNVEYDISSNNKIIILYINNIPQNFKSEIDRIKISGLRVNVGTKSTDFTLSLSINNKLAIIAKDTKKKSIIPSNNNVQIINKQIEEGLFPFNKGNELIFKIDEESPYFWEEIDSINFHKKSMVKQTSKMFGDIFLSNDKKSITIQIINDKESLIIYGENQAAINAMDYGRNIRLLFDIVSQENTTEPRIQLIIDSMFGKTIIKSKEKLSNLISFESRWKRKSPTQIETWIKLDTPNNLDAQMIDWFRRPSKLLNNTRLDSTSTEDEINDGLIILKDRIETHFQNGPIIINYDWIFWYYLGLYKHYIGKTSIGNDYKYRFDETDLNEQEIYSCINKAKKLGYSEIKYNMPDPMTASTQRFTKDLFDEIYSHYRKNDFKLAAYELIDKFAMTESFKQNDKWEIAARYLDAYLSKCIYKDETIYRNQTYYNYQMELIRDLFYNISDLREGFEDWMEESKYEIFDSFNENLESFQDCSEFENRIENGTYFQDTDIKIEDDSEIGYNEMFVEIHELDNLNYSKYYKNQEMQFSVYDASIETPLLNYYNFGDDVTMNGGESYKIDFNPDKENSLRMKFLSIISGTVIILLLL